jgi:SAM-dependent methyltransferase
MAARDPHRFINELDDAAIERLVARLESRAKDAIFARLFDKYAAQLVLPSSAKVLEVGCGTGAMVRRLAQRDDFSGKAFGVDQCAAFIDAATRFAHDAKLDDRVDFRVGDAHRLDFPAETFDAVFAHTLISHVTAPETVLGEMARVVRPGGAVVIFDGDYASMTYACSDHEFGHRMDAALVGASFNNPLVMRDLPRLLPTLGLRLTAAWGDAVVEIGSASYFKSFAEAYVPYVTRSGLLPPEAVEAWLTAQREAMENGTFFASCNYYTYLACRV